MNKERKHACIKAFLCLTLACVFIPSFLLSAVGLGSSALATSTSTNYEFTISSGNHGWHVQGDTTGIEGITASVNITFYFRNGDLSKFNEFKVMDQNGTVYPFGTNDFVINPTRRYVLLRMRYLATLPLGNYHIDFSCPQGTVTGYFYIIPKSTIYFVQQPETTTVEKGDDATFSVIVTGSAGYSYQWQRRSRTGWKNVRGATTRTMTLRNVPGYMTGYHYRCLVHSAAGDAYSDEVRLFVSNITPTGDSNPLWLYGAGLLVSVLGLVGCMVHSRRKRGCAKAE